LTHFGEIVKINGNAPYFKGQLAAIAYIGEKGISAYLIDNSFDECIVLKNSEFDRISNYDIRPEI
jgi:hypothetical protein